MSQPKIISLKNREGKVFSSIVPMGDGRWVEIKKKYSIPKNKQIYNSEKEWICENEKEISSLSLSKVEKVPEEHMTKWFPKCPQLTGADYLEHIKAIYAPDVLSPKKKILPYERAEIYATAIEYLQNDLKKESNSPDFQNSCLERLEWNMSALLKENKKKKAMGEKISKAKYFPFSRKTTLGYIEKDNLLFPIGFDEVNNNIVYGGIGAKSFLEYGFSEKPVIYILYKNSYCLIIKENID